MTVFATAVGRFVAGLHQRACTSGPAPAGLHQRACTSGPAPAGLHRRATPPLMIMRHGWLIHEALNDHS
jgi:hypothetical protein